jgi:hypothetical protein
METTSNGTDERTSLPVLLQSSAEHLRRPPQTPAAVTSLTHNLAPPLSDL